MSGQLQVTLILSLFLITVPDWYRISLQSNSVPIQRRNSHYDWYQILILSNSVPIQRRNSQYNWYQIPVLSCLVPIEKRNTSYDWHDTYQVPNNSQRILVILHNKTRYFSTSMVILTIFSHGVHNLFIFAEYIITIEMREGSDYKSHT